MLFCCSMNFFGNSQRISIFSQNWLSQKGALKYSESLFFLAYLKPVNLEENLDLFKQLFLLKPVKWGKYYQKRFFSPQSEPNIAKLCFSVVLKYSGGNSQSCSLFRKKKTISERRTEILRKFVFLNMFEKGKIMRKIWICLNNLFWSKQ